MSHSARCDDSLSLRDLGVTPESAPHRSRKNRRAWCRGKPGRRHVVEVRLSNWAIYQREHDPTYVVCRWWPTGTWPWIDGVQQFVPRTWYWECAHMEVCKNCGKHLRFLEDQECPDWRERVP